MVLEICPIEFRIFWGFHDSGPSNTPDNLFLSLQLLTFKISNISFSGEESENEG